LEHKTYRFICIDF